MRWIKATWLLGALTLLGTCSLRPVYAQDFPGAIFDWVTPTGACTPPTDVSGCLRKQHTIDLGLEVEEIEKALGIDLVHVLPVVQDEGTPVADTSVTQSAPVFNFIGSGVAATYNAGADRWDITVSTGAAPIVDLGDDGTNESDALVEIAVVNDPDAAFAVAADKLTIDAAKFLYEVELDTEAELEAQIGIDVLKAADSIDKFADVDTTTSAPADGEVLTWVDANGKWEPAAAAGGSAISFDTTNDGANESTALSHIECDGGGMLCSEPVADELRVRVDPDLDALAANTTDGLLTRTGAGAATGRTVTGTAEEISVANGDGVAGNPTVSLPSPLDLSDKTLKGALPLLFEGLTDNAFETTLSVTDPTADRTFTLPDADSVAVQPQTCSGTNKISAISAAGAVTCSADETGAGGGDAISIDGVAATDPDFTSDGSLDAIRCTGAGTPDASCAAAEDVIYRLNAGAVDAITEIAAGLKTGADGTLVTGTAGTSGNCAEWNVDGDVVDAGAPCGGGSSLPVADTTSIVEGSADATKEVRLEVDGLSTGTTRVLTVPDRDITLAGTAGTLTSGNCAEFDASGNLVDAGAACGTGGGGGGLTFARKTASESVTSSTTLQDDDHLTFAIAADETWEAVFHLVIGGSTAGDFKYDFSAPTGATLVHTGHGPKTTETAANPPISSGLRLTAGNTAAFGTVGTTSSDWVIVTIRVIVANGANAGDVTLRWAQNTSDATATTLQTFSYVLAHDQAGGGGGGSSKPFLERTANQSMNAGTGTIASRDFRNGRPVLDFDASTDECDYFTATLPAGYAGGGITVKFPFLATTATSGDVVFRSAFERYDTATDLDADSFGTEVTSSATTTSATSGAPIYISIAHTDGAQIDSLAAGEMFRHRLCRDADNGSDTMAGDAEVPGISYLEP